MANRAPLKRKNREIIYNLLMIPSLLIHFLQNALNIKKNMVLEGLDG